MFQLTSWLFYQENLGVGMTRHTIPTNITDQTAAFGFEMMGLGFVLWTLLGAYLETVIPTEYGHQKHPCFCFRPQTYRNCCKGKRRLTNEDEPLVRPDDSELELRGLHEMNYEPAAKEIQRLEEEEKYLRIEDLQKTYPNGFHAVKGLNLKIYQNQIFALLGQNGAGKSTTISMLTGLIQKSEGQARVYGVDLFEATEQVRHFLGVCPQHDVLFDFLTPVEHLSIFYDFKGGDPEKKDQEIVDLIRDVGLEEDQHKVAGSLSGGNKRKLSVAIALCAGSKLVLLDEPTAGMDLGARRALWDMLKNYRNNRIIILTTHYMDEADVLGDRIAIMAHGQLKCLGSSLFLKKRFGAGYKLTMVKAEKA